MKRQQEIGKVSLEGSAAVLCHSLQVQLVIFLATKASKPRIIIGSSCLHKNILWHLKVQWNFMGNSKHIWLNLVYQLCVDIDATFMLPSLHFLTQALRVKHNNFCNSVLHLIFANDRGSQLNLFISLDLFQVSRRQISCDS